MPSASGSPCDLEEAPASPTFWPRLVGCEGRAVLARGRGHVSPERGGPVSVGVCELRNRRPFMPEGRGDAPFSKIGLHL